VQFKCDTIAGEDGVYSFPELGLALTAVVIKMMMIKKGMVAALGWLADMFVYKFNEVQDGINWGRIV
jgi:hypothetical protein